MKQYTIEEMERWSTDPRTRALHQKLHEERLKNAKLQAALAPFAEAWDSYAKELAAVSAPKSVQNRIGWQPFRAASKVCGSRTKEKPDAE